MTLPKVRQRYRAAYPLADIVDHPDNPTDHSDTSVLDESLDRLGFFGAVLLQESTGRLIGGHGRVIAARAAGATSLPALIIDVDDDTALRMLLVDNHRAPDDQALLLAALQSFDDLTGTGYTLDDRAAIEQALQPPPPPWDGADESGYTGSGMRELVLQYPTSTFDRVSRLCAELRRKLDVETNADVVAAIVESEAKRRRIKLGDD